MCGRYASHLPSSAIAALFRTQGDLPNLGPNWNTAPTQAVFVVRRHPETRQRRLDTLLWGLIPQFNRDLMPAHRPISARAEILATSGMFRGALAPRPHARLCNDQTAITVKSRPGLIN
jgi:putative SOS response-associated peptidase YedK